MRGSLLRIFTAVLALVFLAAAGLGGFWLFRDSFTYWNGSFHRLDAENVSLRWVEDPDLTGLDQFPNMRRLDLRGTGITTETFDRLRARYPHCDIRWDVPFQGRFYDQDITKVKLTALTDADVLQLDYLTELLSIDAWECEDHAQLAELQRRRPDVKVFYSVDISGKEWDCDTWHMELTDPDIPELEAYLTYLPMLEKLHLSGDLPEAAELERLRQQFPQVAISWETSIFGTPVDMQTRVLDLSGNTLRSAGLLERTLPLFPGLEEVNLLDTGIPQEELLSLAKTFPRIRFLFELTVGQTLFRTDAGSLDLSGQSFSSLEEIESLLPCFWQLDRVDMCGCGFSSQEMAALGDRHKDIRFIWTVNLAGEPHRTDAVYFTPNRLGLVCTDANIAELQYCVDMVCVDVGHAENVTHCDWAANMPKLKYLILADSGVRDISGVAGLKELVFLEIFQSKVKDYSPLLGCTALEDLNLCWTYGDPEPILQMSWLKRLWWSGAPWNARGKFPEALPDTEIEIRTQSSTGAGWRDGQHYFDMRDFIGMEYMTG